jgi:hypothetical protein
MSDIKVNLKLDGSDFSATTRQAQDAVDDLNDKLKKLKGPLGDASGGISSFGGKLGDAAKGIAAVTAGLAAAAAAAAGYGLVKAIEGAIEAEQAFNAVANSLRLSGELSQAALEEVEKFAAELQDLTGLGDDTTYSMLAMAQSFGLTKDEAKKVVAAANDMSVATGKDLKTSVEALSKSFNGSAKELSKLNPKIKTFTAAQLAAGAAVEEVSRQYSGSAARRLETFGGAVSALKGRFGDLLEEIGFLITKNPAVVSTVREVERGIKALTEIISNNAETIRTWVTGAISDFLNGLSLSIRALGLFGESVGEVENLSVPDIFTKAGKAVAFLVDQFLAAKEAFRRLKFEFESDNIQQSISNGISVPQEAFDNLQRLKDDLDAVTKAREDLLTAVAQSDGVKFAAPDTSPFVSAIDKLKAKIDSLPSTVAIDLKTTGGGGGKVGRPDGSTVKGDGAKQGPSVMDASDAIRVLRGLGLKFKPIDPKEVGVPTSAASEQVQADRAERTRLRDALKEAVVDAGASFAVNVLSGAEGAKKFLSATAAGFADAFLPGAGAAVGPIVEALSQGPEAVKAQVNAFADALPVLLENIADAIPVVVETLADRAPDIIVALVKAVPKITVALIEAFSNPQIYLEVARGLAQAAVEGSRFQQNKFKESTQQFKDGIGEATRKTVSGLLQIGPFLVQAVTKAGDAFSQFLLELPGKITVVFEQVFAFIAQALSDIWVTFRDLVVSGLGGIIPAFMGAIGPALDGFGVKFNQVFTDAIKGAGRFFYETWTALITGTGEKLTAVFGGLPAALSSVWTGIRDGFANALRDIPNTFADAFKEALSGLIPGGGGGGGNGFLSSIGLATGGAVVRGAGNRDTVPALLSPGEIVVDRTTGPRLNAFLDKAEGGLSQSSGSSDPTTLALLAKVVDLLQKPVTVETAATVDGRTLADIILKLNRTNQRLA